MNIVKSEEGFQIKYNGIDIINHSKDKPFFYVGRGTAKYDMYRGNFQIEDDVFEKIPLRNFKVEECESSSSITLMNGDTPIVGVELFDDGGEYLKLSFSYYDDEINRVWIRVAAQESEKIFGCGEQFTHFNLRGKKFPLWTSEPGVGRNKKTYTTFLADVHDRAGGDYYNTNYPQPTFVSSEKYFCHLDCTAYMDFNFKNESYHELQAWDTPAGLTIGTAQTFVGLAKSISEYFGHQPALPAWTHEGVVLGIQGGTEVVQSLLDKALDRNISVAGLWCQDWEGINNTSFGQRLYWNWKWDKERYPGLDKKIWELKKEGIRFLGYITPFVLENESIFNVAKAEGYLVKDFAGQDYLVDFGEFNCGIIDLTSEEAVAWYKKDVITKNLIDFGLDGWMADFGEYLPTDCILSNGKTGEIMHNMWPALWAKTNYEAVSEAGKLGEIVYFMRAGFTGTQRYCPLLWAGDQCVEWCIDDGIASVVVAALSSGILGNCYHHSDIGGYTTLHGMKRSKELMMRWLDMNTFTSFLRGHEGNRPKDNHQFDSDEDTLKHFARMTNIFKRLKEYRTYCINEAVEEGLPIQRPLFMHYEGDSKAYDIRYEYLFGRDILVAPVLEKEVTDWEVYLPEDNWIHLFSGERYTGGDHTVRANIGEPPVFYRDSSKFIALFEDLKTNN